MSRTSKIQSIELKVYANTREVKRMRSEFRELKTEIRTANDVQTRMAAAAIPQMNRYASATARATTQTKNLTNQMVRHIRQVESLFVAGYGLYKLYTATLGVGHEYNKLLENEVAGMKILAVQNLKDTDAMGRKLTLQEKYNIAQAESIKMVDLARKINPETPYNLSDTIKTYKAIFPQLIKYKATLEDIAEITKKMTILGKARGLSMDQFIKTIDTAFSGQMKQSQMQMALGSVGITNATIKEWQKSGTLVQNVLKSLEQVDSKMAGITMTWDTAVSNFVTVWQNLWSIVQKPIFTNIKKDIVSFTSLLSGSEESIAGWISGISTSIWTAVKAFAVYKVGTLSMQRGNMSFAASSLALQRQLYTTGRAAEFTGSMMQVMSFKVKELGAALIAVGRANLPLLALTAVFEGWEYIANRNRDAQERFNTAINKTTEEIKAMTAAQRAVALRDIELGLNREIDKLNHLKHLKDKIIKQDEIRRKKAIMIYGEERVAREFKENTAALTSAQAELDAQQKIVDKLKEQKALWEETDLSIQGATWSAKEMSTELNQSSIYASGISGGANNAKISISSAANEAARLAQNLMNAVAALNGALRGQAVLKGVMNQAQATYEGLAAKMNSANEPLSNMNLSALDMGGVAGDKQRLHYADAIAKTESAKLEIMKLQQQVSLDGIKAATDYQIVQIQNEALERQIAGDKQAQHDAALRTIEVERQALIDKASIDAQYKNSIQYQTDLNMLKQRELQEQQKINKEIAKGGGGSKKASADAKKAAKEAKKEAEKFTGAFTSLIDKMLSGDWSNLFKDFFSSISKTLAKPFIDDISKKMSSVLSSMMSSLGSGGSFVAAIAIQIGSAMLNSLFNSTVSQAEIDAAKGRDDWNDKSLANLGALFESVMYPQLTATNKMSKYLKSIDRNTAAFTRALVGKASTAGIDLTGVNHVDTQTTGFLGFSSKSVSLIGTGLAMDLMTLGDAMDYTTIKAKAYTTELVQKSSFWGLFKSSSIRETFTNLPDDVKKNLSDNFADGFYSILEAGIALGFDADKLTELLQNAEFDLGKIDMTELSQDEVNSRLQAAYSEAFSGIIDDVDVFDSLMERYSISTEDYLETLTRIAVEFEQATYSFSLIGKNLIDQYAAIDIVSGAGGLDSFNDSFSTFVENFYTDQEKLDMSFKSLSLTMGNIGVDMPDFQDAEAAKEWYRNLIEGWDTSTQASSEALGQLLTLSDGFATFTQQLDGLSDVLDETKRKSLDSIRSIADEWLGSLSYLTRQQKADYATGYFDLIREYNDPETTIDAARAMAEQALKTTATKDEYKPYFDALIKAKEAEVEDASMRDLLEELQALRKEVIEVKNAQIDISTYGGAA